MRALYGKVALALVVAVGSVGLFGAAALGAFGQETSATVVAAVAPTASSLLNERDHPDKLKAILDGLVKKGVITQQQEDAILAAIKEEHTTAARKFHVLRDLFGESAKYLEMSERDLRAKLPGTSLGKIADDMASKGKSKAGLVAALNKAANDDINKALAEKKINEEQAKKLRDGLAAEIAKFVDRTWPNKPEANTPRTSHVKSYLGDLFQAARDYLGGVSLQDLTTALRSGKSLGDLAKEKGKSAEDLINTLVTAANARIDQAVAEKKVTPEQAVALKAKVKAEITEFVNRKMTIKTTTSNTTTAGTTPKQP